MTAAHEKGMMLPVKEDEVFRDHSGTPVVSGAGGVGKWKQVGGEMKQLQRFISVLVPSNAYQKHMEGDDQHLPYLGQLSVLGLEEHEQFLVDSEDLTSCFHLFRESVWTSSRGAGLCGPPWSQWAGSIRSL